MSVKISDKLGYGTMSLTWVPKPKPLSESAKTIEVVAKNHGVRFLNAGEFYGEDDINLKLVAEFLKVTSIPTNEFIISIKGGANGGKMDGSKESVSKSIENIISYFPPVGDAKRPKIIYEQARVDLEVPYGQTIGYIQEFVKSGKIDGISLSETKAETIATAAEVAPISAVEVEYSLLSQEIATNGVLAETSKRGIPIVAYSPLGRGLLTDYAVEHTNFLDGLADGDFRKHFDRFEPENFEHNMKFIKKLYDFAHNKKNVSLETLALSWITSISGSANSEFEGGKVGQIIPIPSSSTPEKVESNFGKLIKLTEEDLKEIEKLSQEHEIKGGRYNKHLEGALLL